MGALKFFNTYALKTFDGKKYLETYTERVIMNALLLGEGSIQKAKIILKQIILNRYQPATPTFLNAGKKQRGEFVSCYLLRVEDNMESIARVVGESLQLSKMGGGVSLCFRTQTNLVNVKVPVLFI
jgi:ribonucleoside-diphosphate reductase alpha chain